jgi:hypothetical protein
MLVDNQILLDTVVVGVMSEKLKAITIASGGLIYLPDSVEQGIKLFE